MKKQIKRYAGFGVAVFSLSIFTIFFPSLGIKAFLSTGNSIWQMLVLLPPIFILIGLLDVWVPQETIMKYMGESSGIKGIVLSFILGSVTSGPLYAAFPVAVTFMKKGVKFTNILIFIGAWSTTKVPMLLFEGSNLGWPFAIVRLLIDIVGILIISYLLNWMMTKEEIQRIYDNAEKSD